MQHTMVFFLRLYARQVFSAGLPALLESLCLKIALTLRPLAKPYSPGTGHVKDAGPWKRGEPILIG
jgi:hypothetical protein